MGVSPHSNLLVNWICSVVRLSVKIRLVYPKSEWCVWERKGTFRICCDVSIDKTFVVRELPQQQHEHGGDLILLSKQANASSVSTSASGKPSGVAIARFKFPETWLWEDVIEA